MIEPAVSFDEVYKSYRLYHHIIGGFKKLLFNLPGTFSSLRNARFEALKGISFEVRKGETFGIIGRNGAGKSTLLGLIAGILKPSAGNVIVRGRVSPLLELGSGTHPELTGRDNIVLNGVLLGMTRAEVKEVARDNRIFRTGRLHRPAPEDLFLGYACKAWIFRNCAP